MSKVMITLDKVGAVVKVDVDGVVGNSCAMLTKELLDSLNGTKVKSVVSEKPEMGMTTTGQEVEVFTHW